MSMRTAQRMANRTRPGGAGAQRPVQCDDCGSHKYPRDMVHVDGTFPARWRCLECPPKCSGCGRHTTAPLFLDQPRCTSCRREWDG